jgi:transposase
LIPKRAGDRVKTDRRDCLRLAELSRAGELRAVWIPDCADEAIRDVSRAREDAVNARTQARHQLKGSCCGSRLPQDMESVHGLV